MRREELQHVVQLIHAVPLWEKSAHLLAMTCVLLNRYESFSESERVAQIQRMRESVEQLLKNDPLTLLREALLNAERTLVEAALLTGDPV